MAAAEGLTGDEKDGAPEAGIHAQQHMMAATHAHTIALTDTATTTTRTVNVSRHVREQAVPTRDNPLAQRTPTDIHHATKKPCSNRNS